MNMSINRMVDQKGGSEDTKRKVDLFLKQEVKMNIEEHDTNIVHRYDEL